MEGIGLASKSLAVALCAAFVCGQQPAGAPRNAEAYRPEAAGGAVHVDIALARTTGLLEEIENSVLGPVLKSATAAIGAEIFKLDAFWMWVHQDAASGSAEQVIAVVAGPSAKVQLPELWQTAERDRVGEQEFAVRGNNLFAIVGDRLMVMGLRDWIEPILAGKGHGGVPGADQLSLDAGRAKAVATIYSDLGLARSHDGGFGFLIDGEYPDGDAPTHLLLRVVMVGDEDDPHVQLEAIVRHQKGEAGLDATEKHTREGIKQLAAMPRWRPLAALFEKVAFRRKGRDLEGSVDLGRARTAVGIAVERIAPLMMVGGVEAVPAAAPATAPAPASAPKEPGK